MVYLLIARCQGKLTSLITQVLTQVRIYNSVSTSNYSIANLILYTE